MKVIKFEDMNRQVIQVSLSGGGDYRVYVDAGKDGCACMLLNKDQAKILIHALRDFIKGID
jgi:hypothetical protein